MGLPVRFATTSDGVSIAYCTHGDGPPLVFVRGWIGHLELLWEHSAFRSYFEALARHFRVIRFDTRGNGLSERTVPDVDLDALVLDLEAVVDHLALRDVILYGATYGGHIVIAYAAEHPERVARVILDGTYVRGRDVNRPERWESIIRLIRDFPDEALQRLLSGWTHPEPEAQPAGYRRVPAREVISPPIAAQLYALASQIDLSALLPEIRAPALVLHRQESRAIPFRLGRELAAALPDARFAPLEGTAHNSWEGDAAAALAAIGGFLGVDLSLPPSKSV